MSFGEDKISQAFEQRIKNYEEQVELEKKEARERGDIYVECADYMDWRIHDPQGYWVNINANDWKIIQKYLDEDMYCKPSLVFLNEMLDFIMKTTCKDCAQKCERCAVSELKKSIERRMPNEYDEDY